MGRARLGRGRVTPQLDLFRSNDNSVFRIADARCAVCGAPAAEPATIIDRLGSWDLLCLPACAASAGIWPWAGMAVAS